MTLVQTVFSFSNKPDQLVGSRGAKSRSSKSSLEAPILFRAPISISASFLIPQSTKEITNQTTLQG